MLKRRRADGSSIIKVDQLRDGIVLFEDVADAEQYSSYMEADTSAEVRFAETCTQVWNSNCVGSPDWTAYTIRSVCWSEYMTVASIYQHVIALNV